LHADTTIIAEDDRLGMHGGIASAALPLNTSQN
jgi:hypothetical protein